MCSDASIHLAQAFARHAAVAVANAEIYWRTHELTQNFEAADNRDRIGQAKGILIAAHKITGDEAFDLLRRSSQHLNRKLRDVADHVVNTGQLPDDTQQTEERIARIGCRSTQLRSKTGRHPRARAQRRCSDL